MKNPATVIGKYRNNIKAAAVLVDVLLSSLDFQFQLFFQIPHLDSCALHKKRHWDTATGCQMMH